MWRKVVKGNFLLSHCTNPGAPGGTDKGISREERSRVADLVEPGISQKPANPSDARVVLAATRLLALQSPSAWCGTCSSKQTPALSNARLLKKMGPGERGAPQE